MGYDDNDDTTGIACANQDFTLADVQDELKKADKLPFDYILEDGTLKDLLPDDFGLFLFSSKLKAIVEKYSIHQSDPKWLKANVIVGKKVIEYFVPNFQRKYDVLDTSKTSYVEDIIIEALLMSTKTENFDFFPLPDDEFSIEILVSESIKDEVKKEKLTGIAFEKALIS